MRQFNVKMNTNLDEIRLNTNFLNTMSVYLSLKIDSLSKCRTDNLILSSKLIYASKKTTSSELPSQNLLTKTYFVSLISIDYIKYQETNNFSPSLAARSVNKGESV